MTGDGGTQPAQTNGNRYAEIVGGESPSPFAAVSLLVALGCTLLALPAWPDVSDWWFVAAFFGVASIILAAFTYLGLPGQDDTQAPSDSDDTPSPAH